MIGKNVRAFTLIELLVVVLIIAILAAVALPQYNKAVWKSRAVEIVSFLNAMQQGLTSFALTNGFGDMEYGVPVSVDMLDVTLPNPSPTYTYQLEERCYSDIGCTVNIWYKDTARENVPTFKCDFTPNFKWSCGGETHSIEEEYVTQAVLNVLR